MDGLSPPSGIQQRLVAHISQVQRSPCSGVRIRGRVQPRVCLAKRKVCSRSNRRRNHCQHRFIRAQPRRHIHCQRDTPVSVTRHGQPGQSPPHPRDVDTPGRHRVIQPAVSAAMLRDQRQTRQRGHRAFRAQHRLTQLEQRIRTPGQTPVELLPETRQVPQRTGATGVVHTIHRGLGLVLRFVLSQDKSSAKGFAHDQAGCRNATQTSNLELSAVPKMPVTLEISWVTGIFRIVRRCRRWPGPRPVTAG